MRSLIRSAEYWAAAILGAMVLASLLWGFGPILWGVAAGGVVGWANIEVIIRLLARVQTRSSESQDGSHPGVWLVLVLPVKLLVLAALAYWLVRVVGVNGFGFLAGVSGALLALVVAARRQQGRERLAS